VLARATCDERTPRAPSLPGVGAADRVLRRPGGRAPRPGRAGGPRLRGAPLRGHAPSRRRPLAARPGRAAAPLRRRRGQEPRGVAREARPRGHVSIPLPPRPRSPAGRRRLRPRPEPARGAPRGNLWGERGRGPLRPGPRRFPGPPDPGPREGGRPIPGGGRTARAPSRSTGRRALRARARRHLPLADDREHRAAEPSRLRHRHRPDPGPLGLLRVDADLVRNLSDGDRRGLREGRLHLGRPVGALRHDALRVPPRAARPFLHEGDRTQLDAGPGDDEGGGPP